MPTDDFQHRFNELRVRARAGVLPPDERAEYEDVKERFARAICAAQNLRLEPGQRAAGVFRVAALFKVEVSLGGAKQNVATMDISPGGFSALLGSPATPGSEARFTLFLSSRDTIAGTAVVAAAEKEGRGALYRVAFSFAGLAPADAAHLEEALFDVILLRKLTPGPMLLSPPRGMPVAPPISEAMRTSPPIRNATPVSAAPPRLVASNRPPEPPARVAAASPAASRPPAAREPRVVPPPPRERARQVDALLDEAMVEMLGASEAARREETAFPPASAMGPGRGPCVTPLAMAAEPPEPSPSLRRPVRPVPGAPLRFAGVAIVGALVAGSFAWRLASPARAPRRASAAVVAPAPPVVPAGPAALPPAILAPSSAPAPSASAPASAAPAPSSGPAGDQGTLTVTARGRRIYIDGRLMGEGPRTFPLACGPHVLRLGSKGAAGRIEVPCGGDVVVPR